MSITAEVHIGTEFGAKDNSLSDLKLATEAVHIANAIMRFCTYSGFDDLPKDSPYFLMRKRYALHNCANLVVHLMQISMSKCEEQPPSTFLVEIERNELGNLAPSSWSLSNRVWSVRTALYLFDEADVGQEALQKEIKDAIYYVCMIAAVLEEDDLEPYVREYLHA